MDPHWLARILLSTFCVVQGAATIVLDLNRTHAAHPRWLGHARFHVVWQTATVTALAVVEVALLWVRGPLESERFYLAAVLASTPMVGFFAALFTRSFYGGRLSDLGGISPVRFAMRRREIHVDMNLVAEVAGVFVLAGVVWLFCFAGS